VRGEGSKDGGDVTIGIRATMEVGVAMVEEAMLTSLGESIDDRDGGDAT